MADFLYNFGREAFLDGSADWDTDDIRLTFTQSGYAPASSSTNKFLADITNEGTGTRSSAFASKTVTSGVADAADVTLTAVASQAALNAIQIYKHTGSDATARLIANITTYTGLPVTPNGGDILTVFPSDSNKIFKL